MDLRTEILKQHGRSQTVRLAKWVGQDKKRFIHLMDLFLHDEYRVTQRSAWIVKYVADDHPDWIKPWIKKMLEYCRGPVHNAVRRNVIRILEDIRVPKNLQGLAATVCFDFLASPGEAVAVKAFSMTVLANIAKEEPGIKGELAALIREQMEYASPGFRSRGNKILKTLEQEK